MGDNMRIDESKCIKCGMCHDNCKHEGITLNYTHDVFMFSFNDNCIQCGECLSNCPAEAIYEDEGGLNEHNN